MLKLNKCYVCFLILVVYVRQTFRNYILVSLLKILRALFKFYVKKSINKYIYLSDELTLKN